MGLLSPFCILSVICIFFPPNVGLTPKTERNVPDIQIIILNKQDAENLSKNEDEEWIETKNEFLRFVRKKQLEKWINKFSDKTEESAFGDIETSLIKPAVLNNNFLFEKNDSVSEKNYFMSEKNDSLHEKNDFIFVKNDSLSIKNDSLSENHDSLLKNIDGETNTDKIEYKVDDKIDKEEPKNDDINENINKDDSIDYNELSQDADSEFPFLANYGGVCSGAIIDQYWILTAAQCKDFGKTVNVGMTKNNIGDTYEIKKHVIHKNYNASHDVHPYDYNFQLLMLLKPLNFSNNVQVIEIGSEQDIAPDSIATAIVREDTVGMNSAISIRSNSAPIINAITCKNNLAFDNITITPRMLCAGIATGEEFNCQDDIGGPLVVNNKLIGIGIFENGCVNPGSPGIYAKVSSVRKWINFHTGI